jgi:hypothetical protein
MKELRVPTRRLTLESSNLDRAETNRSAFLSGLPKKNYAFAFKILLLYGVVYLCGDVFMAIN